MARYDDRTDVDDPFWNEGEPLEPYDPAGPGGRMRSGGREPRAAGGMAEDSGDSWTQFFHEPVREPSGGAAGTGEAAPYGGRRFQYGRESSPTREFGQLYGLDQRGYGHRRDSYYTTDNATPWWEIGDPPEEEERPSFVASAHATTAVPTNTSRKRWSSGWLRQTGSTLPTSRSRSATAW